MPSSYPGALDALPSPTSTDQLNTAGVVHSVVHSNLADAIEAVQAELDTDPSGASATVKVRMVAIEAAATTHAAAADPHTGYVLATGDESIAGTKTFTTKLEATRVYADVPTYASLSRFDATAEGTQTVSNRWNAIQANVRDSANVVSKFITGAVNNGSGLIRLTVTAHGIPDGNGVAVWNVGGVTNANGVWVVDVINTNTIDLLASTFAGTYTSGGQITNRPMLYGVASTVYPTENRGGITGAGAYGDDVNAFAAYNSGTGNATDAFYLGRNSTAFPGNAVEWLTGVTVDANVQYGLRINGYCQYAGIDISNSTHGGPAIKLGSGHNIELNTTSGTKIGTATTQKLGFYNATPIIQPSSTTDLRQSLIDLGLYATGGASPLNLNGGLLTAARAQITMGNVNAEGVSVVNNGTNGGAIFGLTDYTSTQVAQLRGQRSLSDTTNAHTAVVNGSVLLRVSAQGSDGSSFGSSNSVLFDFIATETYTGSAKGGAFLVKVAPTAATTPIEVFRASASSASKPLFTFVDAADVVFGTTTGTKVATATTQKLAFWNATPVVQPTAVTDASAGAVIDAEARTALNGLLAKLRTIGIIAT